MSKAQEILNIIEDIKLDSSTIKKYLYNAFDSSELEAVGRNLGDALSTASWTGGAVTKFYPDRVEGTVPKSLKKRLLSLIKELGIKNVKVTTGDY